jgi:acylphosphatase
MPAASPRERRVLRVVGVVQGVGFRPHVHVLATRLGLTGFVQNRTGDVWIEIEGDPAALDEFTATLRRAPPPLARTARPHLTLSRASTPPTTPARSRPTSRPAASACASSTTRKIAATPTHSSTAPTAARA